jgi:hypothetical protein
MEFVQIGFVISRHAVSRLSLHSAPETGETGEIGEYRFLYLVHLVVLRVGDGVTRVEGVDYVVTKRCRLSLLTNSALVYESQCGGKGRGRIAGSQPMNTAGHIT